jgi:hypothetical protein
MEHVWRLTEHRDGVATWECRRCQLVFRSYEGGSVGPADPEHKFILGIQSLSGECDTLESDCNMELVRQVMAG